MFPLQSGLGQAVESFHGNPLEHPKMRPAMSFAYTAPPATSAWLSVNMFVRPVDLTAEQLPFIGGSNPAHIYMFDAFPPAAHNKHLQGKC